MLDRIEQARPEKSAIVIVLRNLQMTGPEFEGLLQDRDGFLEGMNAGERAEEFDALRSGLAGDVDAGEFLAGGDHQIGECLVVQQACVVSRLDVLDEPVFGQEGFDFACRFE